MTVLNIRGKLGLSEVVDTGDSPQEFVGENPRIDNKFEYDIAVIGLGPVGVRTLHNQCISKERVLGFDASESRLAEVSSGSMSLSLLENKRIAHAMDAQLLTLTADPEELAKAAVLIRWCSIVRVCSQMPEKCRPIPRCWSSVFPLNQAPRTKWVLRRCRSWICRSTPEPTLDSLITTLPDLSLEEKPTFRDIQTRVTSAQI
ncbi:hypothetical protein ACTXMY_00160 [Glutamicibacter ardleyensis]|uniref:hypothetical protein n=1 Tax=Glutamicibacter ardleyensis TaxID=225894 RepID=UPI003FD284AC